MDIFVTLIYLLFVLCLVHPPTEFISAGFTISQIFHNYLGSENTNFIKYHMKRITITALIHSALPLGYILCLWGSGVNGEWMLSITAGATIIPLLMCYRVACWWEHDKSKHPGVRALVPYAIPGQDWRVVAANVNIEFSSINKMIVQLTATSKFIATENWLIKVSQYSLNIVKQSDCSMVVTATDNHELASSGADEVQYVNIEMIPIRDEIEPFKIRLPTTSLREMQTVLSNPVRVPDHISLMPSRIERFIIVFKQYVDQNPVYYLNEEPEACIGCMQSSADVKLQRRCQEPPAHLQVQNGPPPCGDCHCRVLWCVKCIARWWATRVGQDEDGGGSRWLSARCTCPVCRTTFCLLDVCPARIRL